jgi:hypothetical protein
MNLKVNPIFKPVRIIKVSSISQSISLHPKGAVKIPTVYNRVPAVKPQQHVIIRTPPKSSLAPTITKPRSSVIPNQVSIIRPKTKERTLTQVRPSHLRKAQDALLGKHLDKIRNLRGIGHSRILVILACGPSINQAPLDKLLGHVKIDIMCINKPELRVWPSKYWIFCDQSQYNRNQEFWSSYQGTIINASSVRATHPNQIMVKTMAGKGFSRDLTRGFHIGRSTTYASMQVALWMGYEKSYIFGCDMSAVDGKLHRYGQNPDVSNENRIKRFEKEAEHYDYAISTLKPEELARFTFCSSHNKFKFVSSFENLDQIGAVDVILNRANELLTKKETEAQK